MTRTDKHLIWGIVGIFIIYKAFEAYQTAQQAQVLVNQVNGTEATLLGYTSEFAPSLTGLLL
jgi:hypothetical protein